MSISSPPPSAAERVHALDRSATVPSVRNKAKDYGVGIGIYVIVFSK
jgi:hypothetical protein